MFNQSQMRRAVKELIPWWFLCYSKGIDVCDSDILKYILRKRGISNNTHNDRVIEGYQNVNLVTFTKIVAARGHVRAGKQIKADGA